MTVGGTPTTPVFARHHYIGYDNFVADAVLTATNEDAGNPVTNLADWFTYDKYKASASGTVYINADLGEAKEVDSWGVYGHNFADLVDIKLQYSTDDIAWNDYEVAEVLTDTRPVFRVDKDNAVTARWWRLKTTGGVAAELAVLFIGSAMTMPRTAGIGWTPPHIARTPKVTNSVSRNGALLARTKKREHGEVSFNLPYVDPQFVRTDWFNFMNYLNNGDGAFFHGWSMVNYPEETAYCFVNGNPQLPRYSELNKWMSIDLKFVALSR